MTNDHQESSSEIQADDQKTEKKKDRTIHLPGLKLIISAGLITAVTALMGSLGYLDGFMGFLERFGIKAPQFSEMLPSAPPGCTSTVLSIDLSTSQWIGTKIESVDRQQLPNYCPQTTLIRTDKNSEEYIVLRNVDQDLSSIRRGIKKNSGTFTAHLGRVKDKGQPVCLEIYGIRDTGKSEYMNIIRANFWSSDKDYETLTFEQRDEECRKHKDDPGSIIVAPF